MIESFEYDEYDEFDPVLQQECHFCGIYLNPDGTCPCCVDEIPEWVNELSRQ